MAKQKNDIELKIRTIVDGMQDITRLISEIDSLGGESSAVAEEAKSLNRELQGLKKQQGAIDELNKLNKTIAKTDDELSDAASKVATLGAAMDKAKRPTKALTNEYERAKKRLEELKNKQVANTSSLGGYINRAKAAGVNTKRLVAEQVRLAVASGKAKDKIDLLSDELVKTRDAYKGAGSAASKFGRDGGAGASKASKGIRSLTEQLGRAKQLFVGFFAARFGVGMVKDLAGVADQWKNITAKLDLAADSQDEFNFSQEETYRIAQESRVALDDVVVLYSRLRQAQKGSNVTQQQTLLLTETITKAMKVSGASTQETSATIRQLTQSFASGVLRGQEFNSMMEQGPRLSKALADGLDVPVSALRAMADAGDITADKVTKALLSQSAAIEKEYAKLPLTIEGSVSRLENAWTRFIGQQDSAAGASSQVAESVSLIADHLDEVAGAAVLAGKFIVAALAVKGVAAARAYIAEMAAAKAATLALGVAAEKSAVKVGLLNKAAGLMFAAWSGWEIGKYLHDNFEVARKSGVVLVSMLVKGAEHVRYGWELVNAAFSSDTMGEATKRHEQRLAAMDASFLKLFIAAEKTNKELKNTGSVSREAGGALKLLADSGGEADEGLSNLNKSLKDIGINADRLGRELSEKAEKQIKAVGDVSKDAALNGAQLVDFFNQLAEVADSPKVLAVAMEELDRKQIAGLITEKEHAKSLAVLVAEMEKIAVAAVKGEEGLSELDKSLKDIGVNADRLGRELSEKAEKQIKAVGDVAVDSSLKGKQLVDLFTRIGASADSPIVLARAVDVLKDKLAAGLVTQREYNISLGALEGTTGNLGKGFSTAAGSTSELRDQLFELGSSYRNGDITAGEFLEQTTELTDQLGEQRDTSGELSDATEQAGDAAAGQTVKYQQVSGAVEAMINTMSAARSMVGALGEKATASFEGMVDAINRSGAGIRNFTNITSSGATEVDGYRAEVKALSEQMRTLDDVQRFATGGATKWMAAVSRAAVTVKREFLQQKIAATELGDRLESLGGASAEQLDSIEQTINGYGLLDDSDLSNVRSEVARLRSEQEALNSSISTTLRSLQDEMDRVAGNQAAIQLRDYKKQLEELQNQLAQAQRTGNSMAVDEARQAIQILQQLHRVKMQNIRAESGGGGGSGGSLSSTGGARGVRGFSSNSFGGDSTSGGVLGPTTEVSVVRFEAPSGKSVNTMVRRDQKDDLLDVIREAEGRAG